MKPNGLILAFMAPALLPLGAQDGNPAPLLGEEQLATLVRSAIEREPTRPSVLSGIGAQAPASARQTARAVRQARLSVSFEKRTVDDAVDFLRRAAGLNIVLSRRAREALAQERPTVTLTVTNHPLADILDLLAVELGEYVFTIRHGAILLLRREEYRPRTILRFHDVRDILRPHPDFPAPALGASLVAPDE